MGSFFFIFLLDGGYKFSMVFQDSTCFFASET